MQTPKILIVEDNLIIAMEIESCLQDSGYFVCGTARNDTMAKALIAEHQPDLIIMDIDLGEGSLNGIELSNQVKKSHNLPIVYLTGLYQDKDVRNSAIMTNPQGFLVKPRDINPDKLSIAIEMVLMSHCAQEKEKESDNLSLLEKEEDCPKSFYLKQDKRILKIDFDDIVYFQSNGESVYIYTEKNRLFFSLGLKPTLLKLNRCNIIRVHRQYAINVDKIHSYLFNDKEKMVFLNFRNEVKSIPLGETFKNNLVKYFPRLTAKR